MDNKFIWWKHGIIYHIYVRSFYDSNKDGIGDIKGVIAKLNYLKDLGIDAIWLSPIFKSPQKDFGYDVEDYKSINPEYGTKDDLIELIKKAHQKGIKIILDMILNHTSDKHPWFLESRSSIDNPKRNWYIWKKGKPFNRLPNNWKTSFRKKAWTYDKLTKEYYFHSFLKEQPDLNWHNEEVKTAMFDMLKYWLDIGIDGFRLDAINCIIKDKKFRDNPNLLEQIICKKQVYSRNRKKSINIVKSLRKMIDKYKDKVLIGEIYTLPPGDSKLVAKYLGNGENALHMALDFSLMFTSWNPKKYAQLLQNSYNSIPSKGWMSITMSNHDILRSYSKHLLHKREKAKLMAIILLTSLGTPIIYYGEEIGISAKTIPKNKIKDPLGKIYWPFYQGRDKLRSPMQWDNSTFAGFSTVEPWLPLNNTFPIVNVENQKKDQMSLFYLYKKLIDIRKTHEPLYKGNWQIIDVKNKNILAYKRVYKEKEIYIVLNFTNKNQKIEICKMPILISTHSIREEPILRPFEGKIFEKIS